MQNKNCEVQVGNARRFIDAYNKIDRSLRFQYNFKRGQSFGDMIRRCTSINSIVRKFEDVLIDYSRLRNAIIHGGNDDFVIAEPHNDVLDKIEKIADLICTPPLVINTVCRKDILVVKDTESVASVLSKIYSSTYSNLPVYSKDCLVGIANGQRLVDKIGEAVSKGLSIDDFISKNKIGDLVSSNVVDQNFYQLVGADITIDQALNMFYANRKLLVLLVTKTGSYHEPALGIVTVGDIMDLNVIMDNYK